MNTKNKSCNFAILQSCNSIGGQSLVEIIVAIALGAILIGGATGAIIPILRSNTETKNVQIATSLAQEYLDNIRNISEGDWFVIYSPLTSKGSESQFYLTEASSTYSIVTGTTSTIIENVTFTLYFSIENVNRNLCGAGDITSDSTTSCGSGPGSAGVADDPSTQKITVYITWLQSGSLSRIGYFTRVRNEIFNQTDWSGGPGQDSAITSENSRFSTSTIIDYSTTTGAIRIQGL